MSNQLRTRGSRDSEYCRINEKEKTWIKVRIQSYGSHTKEKEIDPSQIKEVKKTRKGDIEWIGTDNDLWFVLVTIWDWVGDNLDIHNVNLLTKVLTYWLNCWRCYWSRLINLVLIVVVEVVVIVVVMVVFEYLWGPRCLRCWPRCVGLFCWVCVWVSLVCVWVRLLSVWS